MAVFASDNFTDTAGVTLNSHSANWNKHSLSGATQLIITNANRFRVSTSDASDSIYYRSESPASADYSVFLGFRLMDTSNGVIGAIGRCSTSANTFYMARYNPVAGGWDLYKRLAGTFYQLSTLSTESLSTGTDYAVELRMSGSTIECYKVGNSTAKVSATDTSITADGKAGVRGTGYVSTESTSVHGDDFSAEDPAGGSFTSFGGGFVSVLA